MIDRYDFFSRPLRFRHMMDRLLEDAFVMPLGGQPSGGVTSNGQPFGVGRTAMDVYEEGDNFVVEAQLPGFKPEDIDISVERGTLTIRGQGKAEEERKERNYLVREHRVGSFMRSLQLPRAVDADGAQATFEHGVLRLTFPKAEQHKPHQIQIQTADQQAIGAPSSSQQSAPSSSRQDMPSGNQQGAPSGGQHRSKPARNRKAAATGQKA
ncbi:MAG: Hsp20/alpha crystallin family protein [Chloroflexota bacterium]|nr:Hsp20/alpha crystallin family protein [Chloroflexota bacterium]